MFRILEPARLPAGLARRLLTSSGARTNAAQALDSIRRGRSAQAEAAAAVAAHDGSAGDTTPRPLGGG